MNSFQELPVDLLLKLKKIDPLNWINTLKKTEIHNVFINIPINLSDKSKKLLIIVIGPSGGGKDTIIQAVLDAKLANQAITATSRKRRVEDNEPEWKFTWMDGKLENESEIEYESRLVKKYDLIEHDAHFGKVYGLPRANLIKAFEAGKPVIMTGENRSLVTLTKELKDTYNIVSIFITADSYETMFERIKNRENVLSRMEKAPTEINDAKDQVNFVLLNPGINESEVAIHNIQDSMKSLVEKLIKELT